MVRRPSLSDRTRNRINKNTYINDSYIEHCTQYMQNAHSFKGIFTDLGRLAINHIFGYKLFLNKFINFRDWNFPNLFSSQNVIKLDASNNNICRKISKCLGINTLEKCFRRFATIWKNIVFSLVYGKNTDCSTYNMQTMC